MQDFLTEIAHIRRGLRQDLGLRGQSLSDQLRYGGRLLPRNVRVAARRLAKAEGMAGVPKLAKQLDWDQLAQDCTLCRQYFRRRAQGRVHPLWLRLASWGAVVLLILAGLIFLPGQL